MQHGRFQIWRRASICFLNARAEPRTARVSSNGSGVRLGTGKVTRKLRKRRRRRVFHGHPSLLRAAIQPMRKAEEARATGDGGVFAWAVSTRPRPAREVRLTGMFAIIGILVVFGA